MWFFDRNDVVLLCDQNNAASMDYERRDDTGMFRK
ncbi:MAG: hypothetical protein MHPDNHAH_00143 [Anaerolineales bacterium]|nr:hypothetical protein [Anaerolineales bacterium]